MADSILEELRQSLSYTEDRYHRLVILVGGIGTGKTRAMRDLSESMQLSVINLNYELSGDLLELSAKQRSLRLPEILENIMKKAKPPVFLDNLELLFDGDLKQNPLRLLQGVSRNRSVVASWNGSYVNNKLTYAEVTHPDHRSYDESCLLVVSVARSDTML